MKALPIAGLVALGAHGFANAAPSVVTDIPPVHSLVSMVMEGVGSPSAPLAQGDAHGHRLTPRQAADLRQADLVVWIGPALMPQLSDKVETLAAGAAHLTLGSVERSHGHDEHESAQDAHEHHHHGEDSHYWLDPVSASEWLHEIAESLGALDPANADSYERNAQAALKRLEALDTELGALLAPYRGASFMTEHDAFGLFAEHYELNALALADSHAVKPGPREFAKIVENARADEVRCIFVEPQSSARLAKSVAEKIGGRTGTLDPLGSTLTLGPALYPAMMSANAQSIADCLSME